MTNHLLFADQSVGISDRVLPTGKEPSSTPSSRNNPTETVPQHIIPSQLAQIDAEKELGNILKNYDDGELFLEFCQNERLVFGEGKIKASSNSIRRGMGLRAIAGETCYFAHDSTLSLPVLRRLAEGMTPYRTATASKTHRCQAKSHNLYCSHDPAKGFDLGEKVSVLQAIDAKAREHPYIQDVNITLQSEWQVIAGLRPEQAVYQDFRPRCELSINVVMRRRDQRSSGNHTLGGRESYGRLLSDWPEALSKAMTQAERMLEAVPGPAGTMDVVLGSGWPGILLHEAIGHGLEADFNRKQTSVFSHLMGQQIADCAVTIVDQGDIAQRRGSLHIDDEGTPTQCTTLIEDGILVGYMQDRLNARLMNQPLTGNGRRQSYQHLPMPRMTNTYMQAGAKDKAPSQADLIAEVKQGILATNFGGGSVDITSGQFVFNCTEAYHIENGQIGAPIKGASLIGMGAEALRGIRAVGNDLRLDSGSGMCGKNGQWVPVGVGQPSLLIGGLQVGGSKIIH